MLKQAQGPRESGLALGQRRGLLREDPWGGGRGSERPIWPLPHPTLPGGPEPHTQVAGHIPMASWMEAHLKLLQSDSLDWVAAPLNKF